MCSTFMLCSDVSSLGLTMISRKIKPRVCFRLLFACSVKFHTLGTGKD